MRVTDRLLLRPVILSPARSFAAAVALVVFIAGALVAAQHPLAPGLALSGFVLWTVIAGLQPGWWLFVVPAVLPIADASPWTGWSAFIEFDLVVMGGIAAGYARLAWPRGERRPQRPDSSLWFPAVLLPFVVTSLLALARGIASEPGTGVEWPGLHAQALGSWRVGKTVVFAALLAPLAGQQMQTHARTAWRRFTAGMLAGIALFLVGVGWERAAYPGLFDVASPYRTVGLFWEMHLGGAAIDAYLAMTAPVVAWALWTSSTAPRWFAAASLALVFEYACLTSFSRGAWLGAVCGVLTLALLRRRRTPSPHGLPAWRSRARGVVLVLLLLQALLIGTGAFMSTRTRLVPHDFGDRLSHWRDGVRLLHGASAWTLGTGLGRFPAEFAAAHPELVAGALGLAMQPDSNTVRLSGPPLNAALSARYGLTQRIPLDQADHLVVGVDVRTDRPTTLDVSVCELHLLYEGGCQRGAITLPDADGPWRHVELELNGPPLDAGPRWAPRQAVLALAVDGVGATVSLGHISARNRRGTSILRNGDFALGFAHWLPAAREYYLPWHIDSLWLELLVEQGVLGVAAFAALLWGVLRRLAAPRNRGLANSPLLAGCLAGALCVGLVSSIFDMPRVAFLLLLLAVLGLASQTSDNAEARQ